MSPPGSPTASPPCWAHAERALKVELKILDRRLTGWGFPHYGSSLAAGIDLHACLDAPLEVAPQAPAVLVSSGIAFRIGDAEWCGLVLPRSGLAARHGIALVNAPGLIDSGYRGEVVVLLLNTDRSVRFELAAGDRIAQLVLVTVQAPEVVEVEELAMSERGAGGFGSSG